MAPRPAWDPRWYQIVVLGSLLVYGVLALDFAISLPQAAVIIGVGLLTQLVAGHLVRLPRFDPLSPLISCLSLCLLLRTDHLAWAALAAVIAIASKFVLRVGGKHVFNPTNLAIVALLLVTDRVWVSPGQWGNPAFVAFLMAGVGSLVVHRSARSDVTLAFLATWVALLVGRSLWVGEPLTIPLHRLASGALVLFAFHMISDPRSTPDARAGRVVFAILVAVGAWYWQFRLFHTNGLLWSLAAVSLLTPLLDRLFPGRRFGWDRPTTGRLDTSRPRHLPNGAPMPHPRDLSPALSVRAVAGVIVLGALVAVAPAQAFCGFYVAKADTKLFNKASQVVLVRDDNRTVLTMANDYRGDARDFAIVIPVPTFLEREQIHVGDRALIEHLDAYTSPRLVEYFDEDPCAPRVMYETMAAQAPAPAGAAADMERRAKSLGVTIEAQYTVGEYDILILSAKESSGLETWLRENGYRIPNGASSILTSYLNQGMRFFVAKVNLKEQGKLGLTYLRPLQMAFESPKFMLPVRLGTVNADGPQELFVYALSRQGRVETTNYRTVRLPSDAEVPEFVKEEFGDFYKAMFSRATDRENMSVVFLEYAWDMGWCDPCAADPLSADELRQLGVFWLDGGGGGDGRWVNPAIRGPMPPTGGPVDVFVSRLHVRYDAAHFPEDLVFQATGDRGNFQGRYILRHPWRGKNTCDAMPEYQRSVREREARQAETLASLTGWDLASIHAKMGGSDEPVPPGKKDPWWKRIWN
jgi:hypothetical protein